MNHWGQLVLRHPDRVMDQVPHQVYCIKGHVPPTPHQVEQRIRLKSALSLSVKSATMGKPVLTSTHCIVCPICGSMRSAGSGRTWKSLQMMRSNWTSVIQRSRSASLIIFQKGTMIDFVLHSNNIIVSKYLVNIILLYLVCSDLGSIGHLLLCKSDSFA